MGLHDVTRFQFEEIGYGYYLATPEGDFRDAFDNAITYSILFQVDRQGTVSVEEVCETGIWGDLYWSNKKKNYPESRILFKKLREQARNSLLQEKAA